MMTKEDVSSWKGFMGWLVHGGCTVIIHLYDDYRAIKL